jgi:hypothetical protein
MVPTVLLCPQSEISYELDYPTVLLFHSAVSVWIVPTVL